MASNAGIYWIASYPRSGNTWLRFLLTAYLATPPACSADVAAFVPDLHTPGAPEPRLELGQRRFIKTHFVCGHRHPQLEATRAAIVLVRHPAAVLHSNIAFRRALGQFDRETDQGYAAAFLRHGGDPEWMRLGFGTWGSMAASWLDNGRFPALMVRYEDMLDDPARELERIIVFLNESPDRAKIRAAVSACSLAAMREMERREKQAGGSAVFAGTPEMFRRGHAFIAEARRPGSLEGAAPDLNPAASELFAPMMRRLGYL